jgi:hypothetical protein
MTRRPVRRSAKFRWLWVRGEDHSSRAKSKAYSERACG